MKKFIFIIPLIALIAAGCDDLLKEESFTEVGKDTYVNNAAEAENVLLGVYRYMEMEGLYSFNLSLKFTISSDIAQCEGNGNSSFRTIPTNSHTPSYPDVATTWQQLYAAIYAANDFIETVSSRIDTWDAGNRELATIYLGEARALRALYYFELVRWYGNVVLMKSTAESRLPTEQFEQADPKEVYAFIEEDLKYAVEVLPWAGDDKLRSNADFRLSRGSALGLLTKVYCTWAGYPVHDTSKWEDAVRYGKLLVESGKHSLNPDYEALWRNTCNGIWEPNESLIEVSFYSPTGLNSDDATGRIGKWNGVPATAVAGVRGRNAANWKVTYNFTQEWEQHNDPRMALSIADYVYGYSNKEGTISTTGKISHFETIGSANPTDEQKNKKRQIFTPAKWDTEKYVLPANYLINNDKSNVNWYVLRYSDVLLLYAEALNELSGPTADAIEAVNMVRRRGFGDAAHDLSAGLSQEELREAIRRERAYELCFEGHRKQDLIRWGIYYKSIRETAQALVDWYEAANYPVSRYTIEGRHELMPIPQRDLDLMPLVHQNPGWGK